MCTPASFHIVHSPKLVTRLFTFVDNYRREQEKKAIIPQRQIFYYAQSHEMKTVTVILLHFIYYTFQMLLGGFACLRNELMKSTKDLQDWKVISICWLITVYSDFEPHKHNVIKTNHTTKTHILLLCLQLLYRNHRGYSGGML